MADTVLRVSEEIHAELVKAQAKEIGRRGKPISLKKFTEEVIAAGIKYFAKKR